MVSRDSPAKLHRVNVVRRLPLYTELGLLALLIWLLAGWLLPSDEGSSSASQPQPSETASLGQPALSELIAVPLFGKTPPQSAAKAGPAQQSPPMLKPLHIILRGTVVAREHSAAVLLLDGKLPQKTVFVGEQIQPGVTLFHVDADTVVIEQSGRRQLVSLQSNLLQGATVSADKPTTISSNMADAGGLSVARPRVAGLARLLTQAIFTPHVSDGKQDGLQISHIVIGLPFQKIGLYNGDIIRSVNGQVFNQTEQQLDLLSIMQAPGSIDYEIFRAGKIQHIHDDQ
ncbi:MAG: hypothetical protein COX55_02870 [Zetaproteobacteria bacterium CG23_combo_of_CG06-09_8_20_14_all_54_7]|nr:MAG: hypothetical protein COX55_02870 [Zetaproteobacteria bacterium CG23_combo_of_CG06-09_8_20_14_all_54_7]